MQFRINTFQNRFRIPQNLVIPESQYPESLRCESSAARGILSSSFTMLTTIGLDDEAGPDACKIDNVGGDDELAAKLETVGSAGTQVIPQQALGIGHPPAQRAGA